MVRAKIFYNSPFRKKKNLGQSHAKPRKKEFAIRPEKFGRTLLDLNFLIASEDVWLYQRMLKTACPALWWFIRQGKSYNRCLWELFCIPPSDLGKCTVGAGTCLYGEMPCSLTNVYEESDAGKVIVLWAAALSLNCATFLHGGLAINNGWLLMDNRNQLVITGHCHLPR